MSPAKRTSERKKGTPATRKGTSKNSEEGPPDTAERERPTTSETPASVEAINREEALKNATGRMPLTLDVSASLVGSSGSGNMRHAFAAEGTTKQQARGSTESNRPGKGSVSRERSTSGSLPHKDVEEFRESLHEWKPQQAVPKIRSFEEDDMLKRPPPDFVLGPEHWLGLHRDIWEKLWQAYRLVNPTTFVEAEQSSKVVEAIPRAREELAEKKARQVFEEEHQRKISDLQNQLEETVRQMWTQDRVLRNAEERIAGAEALIKKLRAEVAATSTSQRETYNQYHRYCRQWRTEEARSEREYKAAFHQDWLHTIAQAARSFPSGLSRKEDSRLAGSQRTATPPPTSAEASNTEVPAWVGSTSERRPLQPEVMWAPQPRERRTKFVDRFNTFGKWKFNSLRELASSQYRDQTEPLAQRAIVELGPSWAVICHGGAVFRAWWMPEPRC